jgi:hypothetical protein
MAHSNGPDINVEHVSINANAKTDDVHLVDHGHRVAHVHGVHIQEVHGQNPEEQQRSDYKNLGDLLRRCGVECFDKRGMITCFWPAPLLQRIMTPERVIDELRMYEDTEPGFPHQTALTLLADTILHHHCKIFAVLVLISKGRFIQAVIDAHVEDTHLPLQTSGTGCHLYNTHRDPSQLSLVQCFERPEWEIVHRESFSQYQYAVDPRVLKLEDDGRTPRHEDFHDKIVLPFTEETKRHQGGYGVVTKVTIHEGCHEFNGLLKSVRWSLHAQAYCANLA